MRVRLKSYALMAAVSCLGLLVFFKADYIERLVWTPAERQTVQKPNEMACKWPVLQLYYPKMYKKKEKPVNCTSEENWIFVDNGTLKVSPRATRQHGSISCDYTPIHRSNSDFKVHDGDVIRDIKDGYQIPTDFSRIKCVAKDGKTFSIVHSAISRNNPAHMDDLTKAVRPSMGLNVVIIAIDSVSRLQWLRALPHSHKYLTKTMGAVNLEGVNVVGEGTPAAMFPLLTGKTEDELPLATKNPRGTVLDGSPFLWKEMKKAGYVTAFNEDSHQYGCFTFRLKGFAKQPTDHYARTYYMATETGSTTDPCLGSNTKFRIAMDYINDTLRMYPNRLKFVFTFLGDFTHSKYKLRYHHADDELTAFLRRFDQDGHRENTLLVVMADHGTRFSHFRSTVQGKVESLLPYVSIVPPPWFKESYPQAFRNLQINSKRLVTTFDFHEMLLDVLRFRGTNPGTTHERGISLFREIPPERTCEHADIQAHWCSCLEWSAVPLSDPILPVLTKEIINKIRDILDPMKHLCHELRFKSAQRLLKYSQSESVLKFKDIAKNASGIFVPIMTDRMKNEYELYQVTLFTEPGDELFQVTVKRDIASDAYRMSADNFDRINKYGDAADCLETETGINRRDLKKFCYCRSKST